MMNRMDMHRMVDAVAEVRSPVLEQVLRASLGEPPSPRATRWITPPTPNPSARRPTLDRHAKRRTHDTVA